MFRSLMLKFGLNWLGKEIRAMAEGRRGPTPAKVYGFLAGKKTVISILLGCACAILLGLGYSGPEAWITGALGSLLFSAGLVDKSWRSDLPEGVRSWRPYLFARNHSADIAAGVGLAAAWLTTCGPAAVSALARLHLTCSGGATILAALSAVLVQLGLMAEAKLSVPPRVRG